MLINQSELPLEPHLWLTAWLASSANCPVEVFDWPVPAGELALAVERLQPRGVLLYSNNALHLPALDRLLASVNGPKMIAGTCVHIHQAGLSVSATEISELLLAENPLSAHQTLLQHGIL
ncbi:MAG: hypothetical protein GAK32_01745 [Pseudomonas fluorescens]|nr:MAG: hypothetical protein GAK32_01745 [Pseudomonas fluorescens]